MLSTGILKELSQTPVVKTSIEVETDVAEYTGLKLISSIARSLPIPPGALLIKTTSTSEGCRV